jgi:hypothetical protein
MEQKFDVKHRYTTAQEREETSPVLNRSTLRHIMFLGKYKGKQFFVGAIF